MDRIHQRVMCLTGWLIDRLAALRHGNGEPMVRIYGPASTRDRGGTVAFNLLDPGGRVVDERAVARATAAAGISIRTGCFCNPGAGEGAFKLTKADWRRALRGRARTLDQYLDLLGLPSGGALRASVGFECRRRGAVPGLRGDDLPRSRGRHWRPCTPRGLLATACLCPCKCERAGFGEMSAADRFPQDGAPVARKPGVRAASAMTPAREFSAACG